MLIMVLNLKRFLHVVGGNARFARKILAVTKIFIDSVPEKIGGSGNTFLNTLFICNMFQCFLTVSFFCLCQMFLLYCHIFHPFYIVY